MLDAKLALKASPDHKTVINISDRCTIGGTNLLIIGGPCSVESAEQMEQVAITLAAAPVQVIRGGVHKPRTSPYAFQGLGEGGLSILSNLAKRHHVPVITEVMSPEQVESVAAHADILQIGSRNMQNYELLKAVGRTKKPVMLKRGLSATIEEFLLAAEYILSHGNPNVILCERGIRSFDTHTRNVLDLGAVVALRQLTHLPIVVDPSHAAGKSELIADLARASVACGADGLMIEAHPEPAKSVSDARQAISLQDMIDIVESCRAIAKAIGRTIIEPKHNNLTVVASAPVVIPARRNTTESQQKRAAKAACR